MFCECGFTSTMDINRNSHHEYNNNPLFTDINESLRQSDELLNNDFKTKKNKLITKYLSKINEIESVIEEI